MSLHTNIILKIAKLTAFAFFPCLLWGQKQLTGLWTGTLSNDSSTIRKEQSFEIALTEYRGKVYGYSRSEFIINDTLYYILKRVKGKIDGDVCEVKDDEILSYNFRGKLDKGVKVTSIFRMNKQDSTWHLDGTWKTNKTKNYYALTGTVSLKEENDLSRSKIFPHLEEMQLAEKLPFYNEEKKHVEQLAINKPNNSKATAISGTATQKNKAEITKTNIPVSNEDANKNISVLAKSGVETDPVKLPARVKEDPVALNKTERRKTDPVGNNNISLTDRPVIVSKDGPAALVQERSFVFTPSVDIKSDSLELSLYDNGEIDGDTVSVLLNGNIIIAKEGLKATAIKRTIHLIPDMGDSIILVLYAENLGKYPPNTGLLVIHDGDDIHQVRFSADLKTNAAIMLRRKK
ncbi:MAG: hypothetical protein LC128_01905 [Chitinophagales bacterium]|nr:hypothetical protein [Chitinophagales bacterium]